MAMEPGNSRPVPDPTLLTTAALMREVAGIDARLMAAKELVDEQFKCVKQQFDTAEQQRKEQKADTQAAVDAALTAVELSTSKAEGSMTKQLEQLAATFQAYSKGQDVALNDLKQRIQVMESTKVGSHETKSAQTAWIGLAATICIVIISIVVVIVNILTTSISGG